MFYRVHGTLGRATASVQPSQQAIPSDGRQTCRGRPRTLTKSSVYEDLFTTGQSSNTSERFLQTTWPVMTWTVGSTSRHCVNYLQDWELIISVWLYASISTVTTSTGRPVLLTSNNKTRFIKVSLHSSQVLVVVTGALKTQDQKMQN